MEFEFECEINQMFDIKKEYDLFICVCAFALSDLLFINREISQSFDESSSQKSTFLFRINMGFAREAFELLKSKFENQNFKAKYLESIKDALDKYKEIENIINGITELETFKEHKINKNRHLIFHYPKKIEDYNLIGAVLNEFEKKDQKYRYCESDNKNKLESQDFEFIKSIQYNTLFGFYKSTNDEEHNKKLNDIATLTARIINLLNLLFVDFASKKYMEVKSTKIR